MDIQAVSEFVLFRLILGTLFAICFGIILGLLYKGVDRKLAAHMQGRIGPPLIQPFYDIRKLFAKENVIPEQAIPWIFNLVPLLGLVATISILLYLPILPLGSHGEFIPLLTGNGDIILILYLLIFPSLAMVIGGFSSGSPYAVIGAQREMATMIAYEFPLAIVIFSVAWKLLITTKGGTVFTFATISSTPVWNITGPFGFVGFLILLLVLVIVTPAELSKIPFDSPEAETEIASGLLVEYSGRNLAMFYLADGVKTVVMSVMIVSLFFPYNLSPVFGLSSYPAYILDFIFFLIKLLVVILFSVTLIRVGIARLKIDQIVYTYWIPLTLLSLVGLILVMWDQHIVF